MLRDTANFICWSRQLSRRHSWAYQLQIRTPNQIITEWWVQGWDQARRGYQVLPSTTIGTLLRLARRWAETSLYSTVQSWDPLPSHQVSSSYIFDSTLPVYKLGSICNWRRPSGSLALVFSGEYVEKQSQFTISNIFVILLVFLTRRTTRKARNLGECLKSMFEGLRFLSSDSSLQIFKSYFFSRPYRARRY